MEYELTCNVHHAKHCNDGKDRNKLQYFLNNVLILEQKMPFDSDYEDGFNMNTAIYEEYLLNGNLYQKRQYNPYPSCGSSNKVKIETKIREVKYPISKKILGQFDIPKDLKIKI